MQLFWTIKKRVKNSIPFKWYGLRMNKKKLKALIILPPNSRNCGFLKINVFKISSLETWSRHGRLNVYASWPDCRASRSPWLTPARSSAGVGYSMIAQLVTWWVISIWMRFPTSSGKFSRDLYRSEKVSSLVCDKVSVNVLILNFKLMNRFNRI